MRDAQATDTEDSSDESVDKYLKVATEFDAKSAARAATKRRFSLKSTKRMEAKADWTKFPTCRDSLLAERPRAYEF